ncbi:NAD(P)H-hydrate epimerase [Neolewinella xylanilytica]|uniref:Bifunctional NAD(P)H-hydrate repair enzyme n=1 Tax=Neolewinella xylanilytica TaxID=1514080 RepID=A0A2S6I515_9BACT|nr:NAD(P)H-hydrate dehydratase [Neolewinella xylanilytica]PPK86258.1 NAD(P)H-hydrate epimerase [Neolewinella xylanilytica]
MRILRAEEHRALDAATMEQEGITSLELMERAATAWCGRFLKAYPDKDREIVVLCGPGNNGGDGLVIARLLRFEAYTVSVLWAEIASGSEDNLTNRRRAKDSGVHIRTLSQGDAFPTFRRNTLVLDALFGTGLSRPIEGYWAGLVHHVNEQAVERVAVDLPSGLYADRPSGSAIIRAHRTFSLGYPKLALFSPANTPYLGHWELVPFRLARPREAVTEQANNIMLTRPLVRPLLKERYANDHKGTFGHALLIAGSYGKMGAAVISARALLRAGAGLVTTHIPRVGYEIMQISLPEAMCEMDDHRYHFTSAGQVDAYDTVAVGPGLGKDEATQAGLFQLIEACGSPMVIDADALNILGEHTDMLALLPKGSVLTPHPKEFERLFGKTDDDFDRWELQRQKARELGLVILLKTGYTTIATPDGTLYFNTTGNPGMGTGGTGDALTGVIAGLLAQSYSPVDAARLGVYLHGLAGDLAARELQQESLLAEDVVSHLGKAFGKLRQGAQ